CCCCCSAVTPPLETASAAIMPATNLVCIYKILRENGIGRGYAAQTATQFLQSKTQQMHSRAVAAAITLNRTRSDSMKAALFLTDEAEIMRLMLKNVAFDELPVRDTEAHAGCNCDRWGHPCPGCLGRGIVPEAETSVSSPVKQ